MNTPISIVVFQFGLILLLTLAGTALSIWALLRKLWEAQTERDEYRVLYDVALTPLGHLQVARHYFGRANFWSSITKPRTVEQRHTDRLMAIEHLRRGIAERQKYLELLDSLPDFDRQLAQREIEGPFEGMVPTGKSLPVTV